MYRDEGTNPFLALHREVNRLFDETFRSFEFPSLFGRTPSWPTIDVMENDKEICVKADLPGLDEKEVEVLLDEGVLTIRGEKKPEVDDSERQLSERFHGRFERWIAVGADIDEDKVEASFKNGVLTVRLPKSAAARSKTKRITINGGA
jgi:HSP20 family protein